MTYDVEASYSGPEDGLARSANKNKKNPQNVIVGFYIVTV